MRALALPLIMTLAFITPASAQMGESMPASPPAAVSETAPAKISFPGMGETVLHISATERLQVPQDLLLASLRVEKEGTDPKTVQTEINNIMMKAVADAKMVPTVKVSTGPYYVYQYDPNPESMKIGKKPAQKWRGSQSIELQSTTADDLLKLAGALQEAGLVMGNLSYTLSPEKADEAKDSLMEAALAKVKVRAERAAKAMNKSRTDLVEISVDAADNAMQPPMMMRAMAMDGSMEKSAAPVAEPGETEITLTVTAKALLK